MAFGHKPTAHLARLNRNVYLDPALPRDTPYGASLAMDPFAYSPGTGGFGRLGAGEEALPAEEQALLAMDQPPHAPTPLEQPEESVGLEEEMDAGGPFGHDAIDEFFLPDPFEHGVTRAGKKRVSTTPGAESEELKRAAATNGARLRRAMQRRQPVVVRRGRFQRPMPHRMSGTTKILLGLLGLGVLGSLLLYMKK